MATSPTKTCGSDADDGVGDGTLKLGETLGRGVGTCAITRELPT